MASKVSPLIRKLRSRYVVFIVSASLIGSIITFVASASNKNNDRYSHVKDYVTPATSRVSRDWREESISQIAGSRRHPVSSQVDSNDLIGKVAGSISDDVERCGECDDSISQLERPNMTKREELNLVIRNLPGYKVETDAPDGKSTNDNGNITLEGSCYLFGSRSEFGDLHRQLVSDDLLPDLGCRRRLPRAFIIGVKKGGTNTLFQFLDLHPAIVRSPWNMGWTRALASKSRSRKIYQCFKSMAYITKGQINLANYPGFLVTQRDVFIKMAKNRFPHVKIVVILRNPVNRAISDYAHFLSRLIHSGIELSNATSSMNTTTTMTKSRWKDCGVAGTFPDAVLDEETGNVNAKCGFISRGHYASHLIFLYGTFHSGQILVLDGERFTHQPTQVLQKVERFLGVPPFFDESSFVYDDKKGFFCANVSSRPDFKCMSAAKGRVHPVVDEDVIEKLKGYYRPYNIQLASLLRTKGYEPFPWLFD